MIKLMLKLNNYLEDIVIKLKFIFRVEIPLKFESLRVTILYKISSAKETILACLLILMVNILVITFPVWWRIMKNIKWKIYSTTDINLLCMMYSQYFKLWYDPEKIPWNHETIESIEHYCSEYKQIWSKEPNYLLYRLQQ